MKISVGIETQLMGSDNQRRITSSEGRSAVSSNMTPKELDTSCARLTKRDHQCHGVSVSTNEQSPVSDKSVSLSGNESGTEIQIFTDH